MRFASLLARSPKPRPLCLVNEDVLCLYVYILKNLKTDRYYIGYTSNLEGRINEHKIKKAVKLIYYEAYEKEMQARLRELRLKQYGSAWRALKKRIES